MSNNNNRMIVFASILGAILATGLLALNPSMIGAQMYSNDYGYNNNYYQDDNRYSYDNNHQKKSSHVDVQKIKCVNSNINVNGIDITKIPEDTTTTAAANEGAATDATGAQNGNGWGDKINFDRNLVNICVNVNDNEQVQLPPTTLTVAKQIDCTDEIEGDCEDLLSTLDESDFLFQVNGNNPNPSEQFPGSISGTVVTLNPGDYEVSEDIEQAFSELVAWVQSHDDPPRSIFGFTSFTGDCDEVTASPQTTGTITAGEAQTCTATNSITILVTPSISSSSVLKINGESFPVGN